MKKHNHYNNIILPKPYYHNNIIVQKPLLNENFKNFIDKNHISFSINIRYDLVYGYSISFFHEDPLNFVIFNSCDSINAMPVDNLIKYLSEKLLKEDTNGN